ncbi:MAG TPA: FMN-binding negative transcriptional regulator [Puia sp.]|jgi:transcriptional regulator|nr:FMN-binding negative transcriptional regulator [Puia sp.]
MYDIPYFKAGHPDEVIAYMRAHPFALICGADESGKPVATQIPFLFEQRGDKLFLQGHFMKKQDHTNAFLKNPNVLVVFSGAHTYVSASWYENKQIASTWNYQAVHAAGTIRFQDAAFLLQLLTRLTETYERPGSPSLVQHMDPAYVEKMMQAIVAFEIEVLSIRNVFKLSQNRDKQSQENIISQLSNEGADAREIARVMKEKYKINS